MGWRKRGCAHGDWKGDTGDVLSLYCCAGYKDGLLTLLKSSKPAIYGYAPFCLCVLLKYKVEKQVGVALPRVPDWLLLPDQLSQFPFPLPHRDRR